MKWKSLKHNGVLFPPDPEYRHLSILVNGNKVILTPFQEEMAWAWAKKKDTPYVQDKVFQANFLTDFLKLFPSFEGVSLEQIDFSEIISLQEKERVSNSDPQRKKKLAQERKKRRETLKDAYRGIYPECGERKYHYSRRFLRERYRATYPSLRLQQSFSLICL